MSDGIFKIKILLFITVGTCLADLKPMYFMNTLKCFFVKRNILMKVIVIF